ncbi:UNVERIFIED_CONTAM: hypothetical protein K2H54_034769 [Gekko kuhli]
MLSGDSLARPVAFKGLGKGQVHNYLSSVPGHPLSPEPTSHAGSLFSAHTASGCARGGPAETIRVARLKQNCNSIQKKSSAPARYLFHWLSTCPAQHASMKLRA